MRPQHQYESILPPPRDSTTTPRDIHAFKYLDATRPFAHKKNLAAEEEYLRTHHLVPLREYGEILRSLGTTVNVIGFHLSGNGGMRLSGDKRA